MNKILLIVEGENREVTFFSKYKSVKRMNDNLEVVPFKQNIQELYRLCKGYIFNGIKPNNIVDIMLDATNISESDKDLLQNKFTDVYLIFDLDIQNAIKEENIVNYLKEVNDLIDFFNDSTSIGQLLINYPSMDSIYHMSDSNFASYKDICIASDIETNKNYKAYVDSLQITYDCKHLTQNDF